MLEHRGTEELNTERLVLRPITPEDAEMVYRWMSDPEVCKYERWDPHPNNEYSCGYIKAVFNYDLKTTYQWGVELNGELIGSVSIVGVNDFDQKAILGYCIARDFWSKGYATEAVNAVLLFMFEKVGMNRIEASHSVNNKASGRVLEKVGMKLEGFAKEYYWCSMGFQDSNLYGITLKQFRTIHVE